MMPPVNSPEPLSPRNIETLIASETFRTAEKRLAERRLWKFSDRLDEGDGLQERSGGDDRPVRAAAVPGAPGRADALVLDDDPEPYLVCWDGSSWSCECGSAEPCPHLAALLLRLAESRPDDTRLAPFVSALEGRKSDASDGPRTPSDADEPREGTGLDPNQDLLFFTEPEPVQTREVVLFGPAADIDSALSEPPIPARTPAATTESAAPQILRDLSGKIWEIAGAEAVIRHDGALGRFRRKSPAAGRAGVGGSAAFEAVVGALAGEPPPLTPSGLPWSVIEARRLDIRFDPLLSANDTEPLYEPVPLMIPADATETAAGDDDAAAGAGEAGDDDAAAGPGEAADETGLSRTGAVSPRGLGAVGGIGGGLFTGSGDLIMLDADSGKAARLSGAGEALWFVRLVLSRRVMSASDIRARFREGRGIPDGIGVELPDLPEALKILAPTPVLEMVGAEDRTDLLPRWKYAGILLPTGTAGDVVIDTSGTRPGPVGLRDRAAEAAALEKIERILAPDLAWRRGRYSGLTGEETLPFRLEAPMADILAEYGEALMDEGVEVRLENRPLRRGGALGVSAGKKGGLIELNASVGSEELDLDEWLETGGLVRTRDSYFRLTPKALDQLLFLRAHGMDGGGFLTTSPDNLSLIDAVYEETVAAEDLRADLERRRSLYRDLADFSPEGVLPPPESFRASLRPYQTLGYAWLLHLGKNGLGACLADDMGLGKTVQTLAYLSRLRADGALGSVLLVGPVVTLANWEAEITRFAPDFTVHRYSGPAGKRYLPAENSGGTIILVSYQTLRNDAEKFLDRDWDHVILDEAHYVKNAASKTFKTVRSLRASHRVSLTGTPLENHLSELWSQMAFLNPGVLGSQSRFIQNYVRPVEFGTDEKALSRLSDTVAPFLLRRRKEDVLDDLPPKDETVLRCDMTEDQAEAYDAMREAYQRQVSGMISRDGLDGSRIEILTVLSKLRFLAIHPPLAGEPFAGVSSGKMAVLDDLLEEILEEDHKTLVFSQFLGVLDRAEATCRGRNWQFSRLTGATKNREEQIAAFNTDPENRVFLLSLKAGGVGINLTAADYVVLVDPWWNPAVEAQAVDRAHRMGQTRPVMAYRLITSGTIEEKVLELQERKKNLVSGVLGEGGVPKLTEDEIMNLLG